MQRQTLSAAAALLIAQAQAYKLKPTLAQVQACGVDGRCPVPDPVPTADIAEAIKDIIPEALPADDTSYAPIFNIDISAVEPTVIKTTDSDDKNVYYVDVADQTNTVVQVVTDSKGEEVVLINDVKVEPIVIENFE
jgi:hypothetical protein